MRSVSALCVAAFASATPMPPEHGSGSGSGSGSSKGSARLPITVRRGIVEDFALRGSGSGSGDASGQVVIDDFGDAQYYGEIRM